MIYKVAPVLSVWAFRKKKKTLSEIIIYNEQREEKYNM